MKKIKLKREMGIYLTVAEQRFVDKSLDKRTATSVELNHEQQTKTTDHSGVEED